MPPGAGKKREETMADLGERVEFTPPPRPEAVTVLEGRYARLERLEGAHAGALHAAYGEDARGAVWDYLGIGPFADAQAYGAWVAWAAQQRDPQFYAIRNRETGRLGGTAAWLRITPEAGSIEVGWLTFAPRLQRTRAASEAMVLMARWAFAAGYRRYEWKCNALNLASRRAAERLGFSFEGVFRRHMVVKGRNRDTAWLAMTDAEWPCLDAAYTAWLDPGNFDADGRQRRRLGDLTAECRVASDPGLGS